jgi:hypothetical protein
MEKVGRESAGNARFCGRGKKPKSKEIEEFEENEDEPMFFILLVMVLSCA